MPRCTQRRNSFRRYRWLESGLLPLASAVMRVAWLAPLVNLALALPIFSPWEGYYPPWLMVALLLGASALEGAVGARPRGRVVVAAAGLATVALVTAYLFGLDASAPGEWLRRQYAAAVDLQSALPANLVVMLVTAGLWYRGIAIDWADSSDLWQSFVLGVLVLGGILLLAPGSPERVAAVDPRAATPIFLVTGMLAMALISASEMLSLQRARGRVAPFLNRYWLVSAGSVVAAILVAGWALTQIVSPAAAADALRAAGGVIGAILDLATTLIAWIAFAVMWVLWPLIMALRNLMGEGTLEFPEPGEPQQSPFGDVITEPRAMPPGLQDALRIAAAVGLVVGLALAFYLAERRRRRRQIDPAERRESILSAGLLRAQWDDWWHRRRRAPAARFLSLEGVEAPRRAVREAYQRMLARVEALGLGRSPGETALAHERVLESNLPAMSADLRALADAYQVARYAPIPPTPEQVESARQAWERLDATLNDTQL